MFSKKWRRKRSKGKAKQLKLWLTACVLLLGVCAWAAGADKVKDLQDHFDKETHAGGKVKALDKLSDAQFEAIGKAIQANDYTTAGLSFEKYRDNVRVTLELLKKQEPDADRHSGGYRQLELQVRKGIRELEDTMQVAPLEMQPPLGIVHKDLLDMDNELIRLLFPRRTKDPQQVPPVPEEKP